MPLQSTAFSEPTVHHRADVVHPRLECGHARDAVGQAGPAFVEHEESSVLGESEDVPDEERLLPRRQEVARYPSDEHEVHGTLADDLVRDVQIAAPRIPRLGKHDREPLRTRSRRQVARERRIAHLS